MAEGVATTGEIWRVMDFEITEDKFVVVKEGERRRDYVMDEQGIIAMVRGRGLLVITGCGHPGVINTVRHAMRMTGVDEVYGVVGGLHLRKAREERIERTIRELRELDPSLIAPCHCTGIRAVSALYREFRDRMRTFHVGDRIRIG
ncbi:TPA: MBL fold metallo-hydrolase [Candidatus Bathyarchaeota archaeon]|nr:MBL fold metallo-hydrolase [Candidatus Bathyarchaeota archaeon]